MCALTSDYTVFVDRVIAVLCRSDDETGSGRSHYSACRIQLLVGTSIFVMCVGLALSAAALWVICEYFSGGYLKLIFQIC